jgi:IPT/TIG domain
MADENNGSNAGSPGTPAAASSPSARRVAAKSSPRKAAVKSPPRKATAKSPPRKAAVKSPPRKAAAKSPPRKATAKSPPRKAAATSTPPLVEPDKGEAAGGTPVKIRGRNLVGVKSVKFGGNDAVPPIREINPGLLEVTSPLGATGKTVDIVVETRIPPPYKPGTFTYT